MELIAFETKEGERIIKNLLAYSNNLFKCLYKQELNERGKSSKDYVSEVIERYLSGKDSTNMELSKHEMFLKGIIKRCQYNDLMPYQRKARMESRQPLEESHLIQQPSKNTDTILENYPVSDQSEIDRNMIVSEIRNAIDDEDFVVIKLYEAVCLHGFSLKNRAEICNEYQLSLADFDNGKRRFMNIVKKVFKNNSLGI
ncbi:MAG: hypothetical protein KF687_15715 [Cyclobacteriaceae bacterium]|nr:hypothetical protein [Cyclobacteriaceae bacterium]